MANDSPSVTTAKPPFDDVDADIVLRTSYHVNFRIFRLILSLSSPFFQGMFSIPQPPDSPSHMNDGNSIQRNNGSKDLPIIDVSEDSHTLDSLLRFLYPNTRIDPFETPAHARKVSIAASKYNISAALDRVADKVQAQYVASHPLEVYFLAWQMGWEDVAKAAARNCLDPGLVNSDNDALVRDGMLNYPEAGIAYYRLEAYRNTCRQELEDALDEVDLYLYHNSLSCKSHHSGQDFYEGVSSHCMQCWAIQYLGNVKGAVLERPRKDTLDQDELIPSPSCPRCKIEYITMIAEFPQRVAVAIESALSAVRQSITNMRSVTAEQKFRQISTLVLNSYELWRQYGGTSWFPSIEKRITSSRTRLRSRDA